MSKKKNRLDIVTRIALTSLIVNLILATAKIITGAFIKQLAIVSDGIHGVSDILTTIIALVSVTIAKKAADDSHNFGYKKYGSIASLALAIILLLVSLSIFTEAVEGLITCDYTTGNKLPVDSLFVIIVIILSVSIAVKEVMFHLTRYAGRRAGSDALKADAWHQRIDALSSFGAIAGLVAGHFGIHFLDPIISMLIVVMIVHIALEIGQKAVHELSGRALDKKDVDKIAAIVGAEKRLTNVTIKSLIEGPAIMIFVEFDCDSHFDVQQLETITAVLTQEIEASDTRIEKVIFEPRI